MVVSIEAIRRWGREWDRYILRRALAQRQAREAGFASAATASLHRKQSSASDAVKGLEGQDASSGQRPNFDGPAGAAALESLERVFYGLPRGAVVNGPTYFRPTILQQSVRSIVYAVQYIGAVSRCDERPEKQVHRLTSVPRFPSAAQPQYIIMLIAMSFNGYILISIALGGLVGHFISTWDNLSFEMDSGADAPVAGTAGGQASSIDATLLGAARSANQPDGQQQQQQQQQRPATAGACCSTAYEGGASCCG